MTKANEVNEAIQNELNIPKSVIDKYVFVNQWDMFSFLSQTASERAKTFQFLCGTDSASAIQTACRKFVAQHKNTEVVDNSVELHEALEKQQDDVDECVNNLTAERAKMAYPEDLEEALNVLNKKSDCDLALQYLVETTKELEAARSHLKKQKNLYFQVKENRVSLVAELRELEKHPLYWLYDRYTALKVLLKDIAEVKAHLNELAATKRDSAEELAKFSQEDSDRIDLIPSLQEELFKLKGLKAHFAGFTAKKFSRDEECPTCRQLVGKHHIEQLSSEIDERDALIVHQQVLLEELYELKERYQNTNDDYEYSVGAYSKVKEQLEWHVAKLPEGFRQEEMEDLKKLRQQVFATRKNLRDCSKARLTGIKNVISERRLRIKEIKTEIAEYQVTVDEMPDSDAYIKADNFVESWEKAKEAAAQYSGKLAALKGARDGTLSMLNSLQNRLKKYAAIQNLVDTVSECEDLFHWSGLPKSVSQSNMELLVEDINENLSLFDNPFSVQASDDLTFLAYFPGKPPVKANQLSGGQKVVLAIAFRAALDRVFGHDVGMMFLDEPTAGLDTDNIDYFHTALQQFSAKMAGQRQIAVITHVQELESVFDQVVTVQKE